jgi:hypothetical protein
MNRNPATTRPGDPDAAKGAVEGDRAEQPQNANRNAGALDENGLPGKTLPICEDAIGANVDTGERDAGTARAAVDATETGKAAPPGAGRTGGRDSS